MAGHSKWANIKHRKAAQDKKRGKAFTKLIKEITVCAKTGGGDLAANPRLRQLVDKAKEINMPNDNVTRAIKKGTGELPGVHYESMTYEGYGPHGIAVIVETLTDNKNRTVAAVRHIFTAKGGSLGEKGSVSWMFSKMGVIHATGDISEDDLFEALIEYDVKDITKDEDMFTITCEPKSTNQIKEAAQKLGLNVESAEIELVAQNKAEVADQDMDKAIDFLQSLEENDDVQNVYTNLA